MANICRRQGQSSSKALASDGETASEGKRSPQAAMERRFRSGAGERSWCHSGTADERPDLSARICQGERNHTFHTAIGTTLLTEEHHPACAYQQTLRRQTVRFVSGTDAGGQGNPSNISVVGGGEDTGRTPERTISSLNITKYHPRGAGGTIRTGWDIHPRLDERAAMRLSQEWVLPQAQANWPMRVFEAAAEFGKD